MNSKKRRKIEMISTAIMNKHTGEILLRSTGNLQNDIEWVCKEFNLTEDDLCFEEFVLRPTHEGG